MLGQRRITENPGPIASPPITYQPLHDHHHQPYKRSAQEANLSDDESKKRRLRTNFTEDQSNLLEEAFQASHYPDQNSKKNMAQSLDIPEDRITVWFQNRRAKWRRKEMREKEKNRYTGDLVPPVCLPHPHPSQMDYHPFGGFEGQMEMNGHPQHPDLPTSMIPHQIDGTLLGMDPSCSLPQPIPLNPVSGTAPFHLYPQSRGGDQLSPMGDQLSHCLQPTSLLSNPLADHDFINSYCPQIHEQLTYTYFPPEI